MGTIAIEKSELEDERNQRRGGSEGKKTPLFARLFFGLPLLTENLEKAIFHASIFPLKK